MKAWLGPILRGLIALFAVTTLCAQADRAPAVVFTPVVVESPPEVASEEAGATAETRPVESWLEAQIELSRRGFSCGPIDGVGGAQTGAALRAFQAANGLEPNGRLDTATLAILQLSAPAFFVRSLTADDLASLQPVSETWLGKSGQSALAYETALEAIAERYHAHPNLVKKMNPAVDWTKVTPETPITVPAIERLFRNIKAARIHIRLADRILQAHDANGGVIAHFPVSIARRVEKRPVGELKVTVIAPDPNYTFDPAVFPESDEGRELGRRLILPPGPNNPVGVAWIGLSLSGYGIHGTPIPEHVGRTESHGCFRLANWDARALIELAWVGLPVVVEP
ncbi:MAG TPA: L,D-transpeptidase [Opitutaceae bacterium]